MEHEQVAARRPKVSAVLLSILLASSPGAVRLAAAAASRAGRLALLRPPGGLLPFPGAGARPAAILLRGLDAGRGRGLRLRGRRRRGLRRIELRGPLPLAEARLGVVVVGHALRIRELAPQGQRLRLPSPIPEHLIVIVVAASIEVGGRREVWGVAAEPALDLAPVVAAPLAAPLAAALRRALPVALPAGRWGHGRAGAPGLVAVCGRAQ
mmetsp:Transcript_29414/g.83769  ORF Transcript_29414/g.83769 Transcript_29414/m.83769 type:complete len:210 (+) Transcript_29414:536-1165(+)